MLGAPADDQDHFGFVIEGLGHLRADDRLAVRHQRGQAAHKNGRELWNVIALRAFLDVLEIIQPEADDLARPANGQPVGQARERPARGGRGPLGDIGKRLGIAVIALEPFAEIGGNRAIHGIEIDHGIAVHDAEPRSPLPFECNDFHVFPSLADLGRSAGRRL